MLVKRNALCYLKKTHNFNKSAFSDPLQYLRKSYLRLLQSLNLFYNYILFLKVNFVPYKYFFRQQQVNSFPTDFSITYIHLISYNNLLEISGKEIHRIFPVSHTSFCPKLVRRQVFTIIPLKKFYFYKRDLIFSYPPCKKKHAKGNRMSFFMQDVSKSTTRTSFL